VSTLLNRLFGIPSAGIGFGGDGVQFAFARPLPAWAWLLVVLAAAALAIWSYSRLTGPKPARMALAALRALALVALAVLISGPQLIRPNERVEKDWVLVLLDRSASMTIADAPGTGPDRPTREQQLRQAVQAAWPAFEKLSKNRTLVWLGFDSGIYDLKPGADGGPDLGKPEGRRTSIGAALDQALARAAARPVSGVVIVSDGRSADEPSRAAVKRLKAEHIPVFAVPLGSPDPIADLAVHSVEAPAMAFVNDTIPVSVEIERLGASSAPSGGKVELVDKATGLKLDERTLEPDMWTERRARLTLTSKPDQAGKRAWIVRVVPDGPDLIRENNTAEVAVEFVDRPLRVAQFDGYPRWEYRYIKNLLLREKSVRSASLLLASNRQYLQEGEITLDALPRSPEEWAKFDVVIMGDLPASMFSREQLEQLKEHIAVRGAGLLWVGGAAATPGAWRDSPLADLLPFSLGSAEGSSEQTVRPWDEPVVMFPAAPARRLRLLELGESPEEGWPARLSDPSTGWSLLHYAQRIDPGAVKPTAEVLASFSPASAGAVTDNPPPSATPAVLSMRYGAGRILYVATDEIWRWRYARGEALPERFWLPLIRLQGRESLARSSAPAMLEVAPRRPEVEQPVRVAVTLLDQSLLDSAPASITVRLKRADDAAPASLTLAPEAGTSRAGPKGSARSFATMWLPPEPGKYHLEVSDAFLAGIPLAADVDVTLPDDELRHPETDHPLLAALSKETEDGGGRVIPASDLKTLADPAVLPNREVRIAGTPDVQTLWDKPICLALLVLVLGLEWAGRRLIKLA
jgi:hypothetical protein